MALGHNGAIYVAMTSRAEPPSGPETDFLTVKVDIAGHELWSDRFGERNQTDDTVLAMGADERENVYVAGTARGLPGTLDAVKKSAVVISYDRTGHRRWLRGSMTETDRISAPWTAKVWTSGNTMLFGLATNAKGDRVTRAVFRYDDGSIAWTADYQNDIRADYADLAGEGGPAFACAVLNGGILTFRYVDENNPSQWIRAWRPAEAGPHVRVSFIHSPLLVSVACQATKIPGGPRHITLLAYKP